METQDIYFISPEFTFQDYHSMVNGELTPEENSNIANKYNVLCDIEKYLMEGCILRKHISDVDNDQGIFKAIDEIKSKIPKKIYIALSYHAYKTFDENKKTFKKLLDNNNLRISKDDRVHDNYGNDESVFEDVYESPVPEFWEKEEKKLFMQYLNGCDEKISKEVFQSIKTTAEKIFSDNLILQKANYERFRRSQDSESRELENTPTFKNPGTDYGLYEILSMLSFADYCCLEHYIRGICQENKELVRIYYS